jgi:hypothetical protein
MKSLIYVSLDVNKDSVVVALLAFAVGDTGRIRVPSVALQPAARDVSWRVRVVVTG